MTPKVSIIVPVYNVEKYLDRCVNSLVNQTLKEIEIILVDDGSPDNCPRICDEWEKKDSRIHAIHKKNEGQGLARNSGLQYVTGEYVAFVDSDDYVLPDTYESLYNEAHDNSYDVVYMGNSYHSADGRVEERAVLDVVGIGHNAIVDYMANMLYDENVASSDANHIVVSACMGIYRHSIITDNNIVFLSERKFLSEDEIFNVDFLIHCEKIRCYPKAFYHYCYNATSTSQTFRTEKIYSGIRLYEALCKRFEDNNLSELKCRAAFSFLDTVIYLVKSILKSDGTYANKKSLCYKIFEYDGWAEIFLSVKKMGKIHLSRRILLNIIKHKMFVTCYIVFEVYYRFFKRLL